MALKQVWNGASLSTSAGNQTVLTLKNNTRSSVTLATFMVSGTFAGAQAKLQLGASTSGGTTWLDIASTTLSAAGIVNVEIADGYFLRPHLYSVSAGISIDGWLGTGSYIK